jgi:hypothetical protein
VKALVLSLDVLAGLAMLAWLYSGYLPGGRYHRPVSPTNEEQPR